MDETKKQVGFFSLTCDEGCSIYLIEFFNKKLLEWLERMNIDYFLSVKNDKKIEQLDIAVVEGVISTEKDLEEIKKIRKLSKIVIAMGSCATTGMPSGQRNNFSDKKLEEIEDQLKQFKFLPRAVPLKEAVNVDAEVGGCPIEETSFVETFEKYLYGAGN